MIRQAISCDICGTEMLNANHWFVAYDRGPELRIGAWSADHRVKASARHLCGQTCLHKLVDDFMTRTTGAQAVASGNGEREKAANPVTSPDHFGSPHKIQALPAIAAQVEDIASSVQHIKASERMTPRAATGTVILRTEAWKRERQRQAEQAAKPRRSIA